MNRPRASSATASGSATNPNNFIALTSRPARDRAIENVYFDKIPTARPSSAPFNLTNAPACREAVTRRVDIIPLLGRQISAEKREVNGFSRPIRCTKSLVFPGTAKRIPTQSSTFPTACGPPVDRSLKPKIYQKGFNSFDCATSLVSINEKSQTPPPIPPPPPLDVTVRLGLQNNTDFSGSVPTFNKSAVILQPRSCMIEETVKCDKKSLIVELNKAGSGVTINCESVKKKTLKQNTGQRHSLDSDHALIEVNETKCKPGEHDYACPRCGKCTCSQCKKRNLSSTSPQHLRCGGRCFCNADSIIDAVTCFCCVRACFYHCSSAENNETFPSKPCSCQEPHCCARWTAIGAIAFFLPCILCYPVAKGCGYLCKACNRCLKPGCQCKESNR